LGFSQGAILISTLLAKAVHEDFCVQPEAAILFGLIHDSVTHTLQSYIDAYIESMTLCEGKSQQQYAIAARRKPLHYKDIHIEYQSHGSAQPLRAFK
jgi:hypothetical protein